MQERGDPDNDVMFDVHQAYRSREGCAWLWSQVRRPIKPLLAILVIWAYLYMSKAFISKTAICPLFPTGNRKEMSAFYMDQLYKTTLPLQLKKEIKSFYGNLSYAHYCSRREGEVT